MCYAAQGMNEWLRAIPEQRKLLTVSVTMGMEIREVPLCQQIGKKLFKKLFYEPNVCVSPNSVCWRLILLRKELGRLWEVIESWRAGRDWVNSYRTMRRPVLSIPVERDQENWVICYRKRILSRARPCWYLETGQPWDSNIVLHRKHLFHVTFTWQAKLSW